MKGKKIKYIAFAFLFIPLTHIYTLTRTAELDHNTSVDLKYFMQVLNDKKRNLQIQDVRSEKITPEFFSVAPKVPTFGFTNDNYWIKFSVHNPVKHRNKWYLNVEYPHHDIIDVYTFRENILIHHDITGRLIPFSKRKYRGPAFIIPLNISEIPGTYSIYIKISGSGSKIFSMHLQNHENLDAYNQKRNLIFGIYYGIMIAMVLYNLLMLFSVKRIPYLYYIFFLISINFLNLSLHGLSYQYFWPNWVWWNYISVPFFIGTTSLFSTLFCHSFLKGIRNFKINLNILIFLAWLSLPIIIMSLLIGVYFPRIFVTKMGMLQSSVFSLIMLGISVNAILQKKLQSFYFFLGWLILPVASILTSLGTSGIIGQNNFTENILPMGMLFQSLVFSFSLNEKLIQFQKEKTIAHKRSITNLKKADLLKNDFLTRTSHELKTPLHEIVNLVDPLFNKNFTLPEKAEQSLQSVKHIAQRLILLISDILDFTRLTSHDLRLVKKAVSIYEQLNTIIPLVEKKRTNKNLRIISKINRDFPLVLGDENRLQQILINLISNAVKYTRSGRVIIYGGKFDNNKVIIHIRDTGIGIDFKNLQKIYDAFKQIDKGEMDENPGLGIGLTITKQLIKLHNGDIQVKSNKKKGSRFSITLPIAGKTISVFDKANPSSKRFRANYINPNIETMTEMNSPQLTSGGHVLLVHNETSNLDVTSKLLTKSNYQLSVALSGKECIHKIEMMPEKPDVVLMGINIPDMNGFEIAARIRRSFNLYQIPIIFMFFSDDPENKKMGFDYGGNDYIVKPFEKIELLTKINALIKLKNTLKSEDQLFEMKNDLEMAAKLQISTFPESTPDIEHLSCSFSYLPMSKIGGDYYDYHKISNYEIGFIIADVSGHGMAAALIVSMIKILFTGLHHSARDPILLLQSLNEKLFHKIGNTFFTACYVYLNLAEGFAVYANAGHPEIIFYDHHEDIIKKLPTTGGAIGFHGNLAVEKETVPISHGDRLVLYSDGLTDTFELRDSRSGEDHLIQLIENSLVLTPDKARDLIISDYNLNIKNASDDVTMLILDVM